MESPEKTDDISRRHQRLPREMMSDPSVEILYWLRVTIKIWVLILIGRAACEICFNQLEALPRYG